MTEFIFLFAFSLLGFTRLGKTKIYVYFLIILMSILIAFRGISVGTDTYGYSLTYKGLTLNPSSWESYVIFDPGFAYLCYFFKFFISSNPLDCWAVIGIFWVLSYYQFAKKYTKNIGLALTLFVLYTSYLIGFNIIRQCFALSCVMCIYTYYDIRRMTLKEQIITSLLILLVAYLFHPTMLVFLVSPLLSHTWTKKFISKRTLFIIVASSFAVNISGLTIQYAISFLNSISVEGKLINYMSHVYNEDSGYSIPKLSAINIFLLYTICSSRNILNIFLLFAVFAVVFLNLFGMIVIELIRVYESLIVFGLIYYVQMIATRTYRTTSRYYKMVTIIFFCAIYLNYIIKGYGEITPYVFR